MYEITIGIPVYNIEKYIPRMMDSVMAQTFKNIEILICDDCGTDDSMNIIRHYQQNHPRGNDIGTIDVPLFHVSSTEIRKRVKAGESIEGLVPEGIVSDVMMYYQ